jgi:protein SCO1
LLCFHYDPSSGRYTASVMGFVRLLGAITMLVLGIFLWRAWRRERRTAALISGQC